MKYIFSIITFIFYAHIIDAQNRTDFLFEQRTINMGKIYNLQKDTIVNFPFWNKGNTPLVIYKVTTTCGCIVPIWPQSPIRSGEKGIIKVVLKSKEIKGYFVKRLFVESSSTGGVILLKIKGEIK